MYTMYANASNDTSYTHISSQAQNFEVKFVN